MNGIELNIPGWYIHNNRDMSKVLILGYDGKGNAWVRWLKDDFVNMVPVSRLEIRTNDDQKEIIEDKK